MEKGINERLIELIKDDKELHDAVIRLINVTSAEKEHKLLLSKRKKYMIK